MKKRCTTTRPQGKLVDPLGNPWLFGLVALAAFPVAFRQITVSDCWWHCAIGKWLWTRRTFPDLGVFYHSLSGASCLAGELRWEALGDMLFYLLQSHFGAVGLQLLVWGCASWGVWLILDLSQKRHPARIFLIATLAVLATYQLQLARNSLFSMVLFAGILHLGLRNPVRPGALRYGALMAILLIWSFLHGSCVMGWAVSFLLFLTKEVRLGVSSWRESRDRSLLYRLPLVMLAFALTLGGMTHGRDYSLSFLVTPVTSLWKGASACIPAKAPQHALPVAQIQATDHVQPKPDPRKVRGAVRFLNSLIWHPEEDLPWSNDYWSPFEMFGTRPIQVAFLLYASSFLVLIFRRRDFPAELVVVWCALLLPALGYNRMTGYMALVSAAVLFSHFCSGHNALPSRTGGWFSASAIMAGLVAWVSFLLNTTCYLIPEGQHVCRTGKISIYDDAITELCERDYPVEGTFTTVDTGSYALLAWNFRKPVFVDGFFAPHHGKVWKAFDRALETGDLTPLTSDFGLTTALVAVTDINWIYRFIRSPDWVPAAIGDGEILFAHRSIPPERRHLRILTDPAHLRSTSATLRYRALAALVLVQLSTQVTGEEPQWISPAQREELGAMIRENITPEAFGKG